MSEAVGNLSRKRKLRNIILSFLVTLFFIAVLFVTAGSLKWFWAWMLALVMLAGTTLGVVLLDPGLIEERTGVKKGYERKDLPLAFIMGRLGPLAVIIVAGLDFRFGWSGSLPNICAVLGLVLLIVGYVPTLWAMRENRFFSGVVRIQKERGHHVVTTGPYRFVRHPGYLGSIIYMIALPFGLTSYWALIPTVATIIIAILRTALEDDTLKRELEGYTKYAQRVRYRLLPGVW
ncbi:MAG: isoprenylcysteine carboxylmethyltransferase family protein [Chloroflexi bacterium]|nr:isoprenylcysteine carboxylmethyltransferase family protein [Chloroflexota bacterium]